MIAVFFKAKLISWGVALFDIDTAWRKTAWLLKLSLKKLKCPTCLATIVLSKVIVIGENSEQTKWYICWELDLLPVELVDNAVVFFSYTTVVAKFGGKDCSRNQKADHPGQDHWGLKHPFLVYCSHYTNDIECAEHRKKIHIALLKSDTSSEKSQSSPLDTSSGGRRCKYTNGATYRL